MTHSADISYTYNLPSYKYQPFQVPGHIKGKTKKFLIRDLETFILVPRNFAVNVFYG